MTAGEARSAGDRWDVQAARADYQQARQLGDSEAEVTALIRLFDGIVNAGLGAAGDTLERIAIRIQGDQQATREAVDALRAQIERDMRARERDVDARIARIEERLERLEGRAAGRAGGDGGQR